MTDLEQGRRVRGPRTVETSEAYAVPAAVGRGHAAAFWAVAFAFLVVMANATLPSPLYGLYRTRYDLSTLTVKSRDRAGNPFIRETQRPKNESNATRRSL